MDKGSLTPLIGVGILGSVRFGLFENTKKIMGEWRGVPASQLQLIDMSLCAFVTGLLNSLLVVLSR